MQSGMNVEYNGNTSSTRVTTKPLQRRSSLISTKPKMPGCYQQKGSKGCSYCHVLEGHGAHACATWKYGCYWWCSRTHNFHLSLLRGGEWTRIPSRQLQG